MRKIITLILIAISTGVSGFAEGNDSSLQTKSWEIFEPDLKVVNICDLTEQDLTKVMHGRSPKLAVEFSENTILPIDFYLKGDLINLVGEKDSFKNVEIKQTFYARCVDGELILSSDLSKWKPFLEFITGRASVIVSIQEGKPSIVFGLKTNRRID